MARSCYLNFFLHRVEYKDTMKNALFAFIIIILELYVCYGLYKLNMNKQFHF